MPPFHRRLTKIVEQQHAAAKDERLPLPSMTTEEAEALQGYVYLRRGVMPYSGGYMQQPFRYVQAMSAIMGAHSECEAEDMRKITKDSPKRPPRGQSSSRKRGVPGE